MSNYIYTSAALDAVKKQQDIYKKLFESPALDAIEKQKEFYYEIFEPIRLQQKQLQAAFSKALTVQIDLSPSINAINDLLKSSNVFAVASNLSQTILEFSNSLDCIKEIPFASLQDAFASFTQTYALQLSEDSIDDFSYTIDDDDNVEFSAPLGNVVDGLIETVYDTCNKPGPELVHSKKFFLETLLPLIFAFLSLVYGIHSNIQTEKQLEQHHQEEMSIQKQILEEEQQQTEYLKILSESSSNQTSQK